MNENNQYGQAMTKPLPYGCIKKQEHTPSLLEFNKILDRISHGNEIIFLLLISSFIIKIKKKMLFNEIYPPIFERYKKKSYLSGLLLN